MKPPDERFQEGDIDVSRMGAAKGPSFPAKGVSFILLDILFELKVDFQHRFFRSEMFMILDFSGACIY